MMTINTIDHISDFLQETNLLRLLPNLRQDFVVWNKLNEPGFLTQLIQLRPSRSEFTPEDFSPSKLALLALDQLDLSRKDPCDVLDSIDHQLLQSAMRNFNNQIVFQSNPLNLETVGLTALALANNYRTTNSWNSLIDIIEDKPGSHWMSPLSCLYGFVGESAGLLISLVQPGASPTRIDSAVHIVVSNPIEPADQIDILMGLCHNAYGDLLPVHERFALLNSLREQQPQTAKDFCASWLCLHPKNLISTPVTLPNTIDSINLLSENLFWIEVCKIAGETSNLSELLINEKEISQKISASLVTHYASNITHYRSDQSLAHELSAILDQVRQLSDQCTTSINISRPLAEMAIILARKGFIDDALQLIPDEPIFSDDPHSLFATAVVHKAAGNLQLALDAANRIVDLYDQNPQNFPNSIWGEQFSLINLSELLIELHKPESATRLLELACSICPNDAALLKLLADSYRAAHLDSRAAEILKALISLHPGSIDYHRSYAQSLESTGDWDAGLNERAFIYETIRKKSESLPLEDAYAYSKSALNAQHPELTVKICDEVLIHDPENYQALIYCGEANNQVGDSEKGMAFLTHATQISPHVPTAWLALTSALEKTFPRKTVIETLNNAAMAVPDSADIHFRLGELYMQEDAPTLALPELKAAEALAPENPQILFRYSQVLKSLGHTATCRDTLSRAYHLDPCFPGLAHMYAKLLLDIGELEGAISPLETLINLKPAEDISPYLDYARCILSLHKQDPARYPPMKALIALNEVLQINPNLAEAKALIAETLAANGDREMAFQAFREALDTALIEDKYWLERLSYGFGCVASSIGKHDIAIAALQEAGHVNPGNIVVFKALSDAYLAAGLPEDAMRAARNVLVINGDDPDNLAWFARQAENLIRKEKADSTSSSTAKTIPEEALNALAKAIQLAPVRTDLLIQLASFQSAIDSQPEAQATYRSIASLEFAAVEDLKNASAYLSGIGDHPSAIACLENAIAQDQRDVNQHEAGLYIQLALEYVKNNDHNSALNTLDKAIELSPGDESLFSHKIDILLNLGQSIEALNCIETAIRSNSSQTPSLDFLFLASRINRSIGDFSASILYAQKGISAFGHAHGFGNLGSLPPQYLTQIAEIYRAMIQPVQAYKILQTRPSITASDFKQEKDYLEFICLHTELALETGGQIRSDIQNIQPQPLDLAFPRVMAITARLMNKAGNYKQAEQIYQIAYSNLINHEYPSGLPNWSISHSKYLALHSIIDAALDLGLWEQAEDGIRQMIGIAAEEPLAYLSFAKSITLKAEFYNLCNSMDVINHRPPNDSVSNITQEKITEYLTHAKQILDEHSGKLIVNGVEMNEDAIDHWQARAEIAFNRFDESHVDPTDLLIHRQTPADAAAVIYYLRQQTQDDHDQDTTSRIIKIARSFSRNPFVILQVAMSIQDENPVDALKSLQSVMEQNPYSKNPAITFCNVLLTRIAISLQDFILARKGIETAIEFWQDEPGWHALAAQVYRHTSDPANMVAHLQEATKLAPGNITYHMELGKAYYESAFDDLRMLKLAMQSFERALEIDPKEISSLVYVANTQCLLGDIQNAELNARTALMLEPNRVDIYQLLSKIAIRNNDYQGAYEYANKAIQLNPKDLQSTIILARALSALGRHGEALAKLNSLLPSVTDSKPLQLERVDIIRKINGVRAGLDELKILVNSFPEDFSILNTLAKCYVEAGEMENAIVSAQEALKSRTDKTPSNEQANLHLLIGQALRQSGQLDQAIFHLTEAVQLAPDRLEPYLELGLARKERREYNQALQIFEQATSIDPEDPRALYQAGLALKESKDYKSSETMLRRAVSLAPHDLNIRRQLAAVVALNLVHNPRSGRN